MHTSGRDRELVDELERRVADHPLRERARGQLMLALCRAGRKADALAAYRAARVRGVRCAPAPPEKYLVSYCPEMPISEYARHLREKVGQDLLYWPSAACLVRDGEGRLLFVRQVGGHRWSLPAGAMDPGESPADAARRETREETSVEVELLELAGVFGGGPAFRHVYPNGDEVAWVTIAFEARIASGTPAPDNEEIAEVRWATVEEIQTLDLTPATEHVLALVGDGRSFDP